MRYPVRGEVWLVDLGMTAKVRPCLVVSSEIGDADRALVCLVPHTTSTRQTQFEAAVNTTFLKAGAFDARGLVTYLRVTQSATSDRSIKSRCERSSARSVDGFSSPAMAAPADESRCQLRGLSRVPKPKQHGSCRE